MIVVRATTTAGELSESFDDLIVSIVGGPTPGVEGTVPTHAVQGTGPTSERNFL